MKRIAVIAVICALLFGCSAPRRAAHKAAPVIGITAGGVGQSRVGQAYIDAVCAAGGVPVILPIITDAAAISDMLRRVDGVLMIGGEDIDPKYYGEAPIPELGEVNAPRDTYEDILIHLCFEAGLPLLGICRGEQVINVILGGTLWQDIPSQVPQSKVCHKAPEGEAAMHKVTVAEGSVLASMVGSGDFNVNSFHHQAVKDVAPGFKVTAVSEDGLVEAIERVDDVTRIVAVQFHPEKMLADGDTTFLPLFKWLVAESQK